jgi:hypothetical protein
MGAWSQDKIGRLTIGRNNFDFDYQVSLPDPVLYRI